MSCSSLPISTLWLGGKKLCLISILKCLLSKESVFSTSVSGLLLAAKDPFNNCAGCGFADAMASISGITCLHPFVNHSFNIGFGRYRSSRRVKPQFLISFFRQKRFISSDLVSISSAAVPIRLFLFLNELRYQRLHSAISFCRMRLPCRMT